MERRLLGRTGMAVTVLGFGGSEIGFGTATDREVEDLLNGALDSGLNVIDTGECYRGSESKIGRYVGHRRSEFFLFTKLGHKFEGGPDLPDWSPELLALSVDNSLNQLRTDRIDLLQVHSCDAAQLQTSGVLDVIQKAKADGKARFLGYSGDGQDAVAALGTGLFDVLQCSSSIADQESIDLLFPLVRTLGIGLIAKRPIANAAWQNGDLPPTSNYAKPYWERLQMLRYEFMLEPDPVTAETALRFTLSHPEVSTMIVGTQKPGRWQENAAVVAKGPLPPDEIAMIRARWREVATPDWVGLG